MNVNVDAKDISNMVKNIPYKSVLIISTVITGLLIFLPDEVLKNLFLLDIRNKIGTLIGMIFIVSICSIVYIFVKMCLKKYFYKKAFTGKKAVEKISILSKDAKQIILYMYHNQSESILLPAVNTTVIYLEEIVVISKASNVASQLGSITMMSFYLQPWVISLIDENPSVVKGIKVELPEGIRKYTDLML